MAIKVSSIRIDSDTRDLINAILSDKIYMELNTISDVVRYALSKVVDETMEISGRQYVSLESIHSVYPRVYSFFKDIKESGFYEVNYEPYTGKKVYYNSNYRVLVLVVE